MASLNKLITLNTTCIVSADSIDMQIAFNSSNGGIDMWLPQLADLFSEYGHTDLLDRIEDYSEHAKDVQLKENICFLVDGIKHINAKKLSDSIIPLKLLYENVKTILVDYENCYKNLVQSEDDWYIAADSAKNQFNVWSKYAYGCKKNAPNVLLVTQPQLPNLFTFAGLGNMLDSPQNFRANRDLFASRENLIRDVARKEFIAGTRPQTPSFRDFVKAIESLEKHQQRTDELTEKVNQAHKRYWLAYTNYVTERDTLLKLLWQMPEAAHWALFRIYRSGCDTFF